LRESKLDSNDEVQLEQANVSQSNTNVADERVVTPTPRRMPLPLNVEPTEAEKKGKKKEKSSQRCSHSKSLSKFSKRSHREGGEPSVPLADDFKSKEMRVSEKIKFNISNEE